MVTRLVWVLQTQTPSPYHNMQRLTISLWYVYEYLATIWTQSRFPNNIPTLAPNNGEEMQSKHPSHSTAGNERGKPLRWAAVRITDSSTKSRGQVTPCSYLYWMSKKGRLPLMSRRDLGIHHQSIFAEQSTTSLGSQNTTEVSRLLTISCLSLSE